MSRTALLLLIAAATCAASTAHGAVGFVTPGWTRPAGSAAASMSLTTFQHWDVFTSQTANVPDVANINPNGSANAFDANYPTSNTLVTSTGNLYSGSGTIRMIVVVPNYNVAAERTRFLLQIKTVGSALFDDDGFWPTPPTENDFSRLLVNGQRVDSLSSFAYQALHLEPGSGPTSFNLERAIQFDLPGNASAYTIEWSTVRGSCSQMEISLDTLAVVPEPASLACILLAVSGLRRRR